MEEENVATQEETDDKIERMSHVSSASKESDVSIKLEQSFIEAKTKLALEDKNSISKKEN